MDSATDTDFEAVFKRIFQTEKGSTEGQYARGEWCLFLPLIESIMTFVQVS
jgi:hypothetical protein